MTSRARFELLALAETLDRRATFEVSRRWMKGVVKSIQSLENLPHRCTLAPESEDLGIPLRLLLHGKRNHAYRVYFLIEATATVVITNIRHWAQAPLSAEDVPSELLN